MRPFCATYVIEEVGTGRVVEKVPFHMTPEKLYDSVAGCTSEELQRSLNDWMKSHFPDNYILSPGDGESFMVQSDFFDNYILRPVEGASFISWARAVIAEQERMEDVGPSALTAAQRNPTMEAQ